VLANDSSNLKRKMAFSETGEISFSPVDVKVFVCNEILSDERMENECHLNIFKFI
jgi:hypothetical protein